MNKFNGFPKPQNNNKNFTKVPNIFFDVLLKKLTHSESNVLLKIIREIYGWRDKNGKYKYNAIISISNFMEDTGLSNRSVIDAVKSLENKKIIEIKGRNKNGKIYSLKFKSEKSS